MDKFDFDMDRYRLDDLQCNNLKLLQDREGFCFGCDAVELANFVSGYSSSDRVCELGAGGGIISILLSGKKGLRVTAVEIQKTASELCKKNASLNGLENYIQVVNMPMQEFCTSSNKGSFDIVVTNPPYEKASSGEISFCNSVAIARHEIAVTLSELIECAAHLLKFGGKFFMVHKSQRLADVIYECKRNLIEPKVIQILTPNDKKPPHLFLMQGTKNGRSGLNMARERIIDAFSV